MWQRRLRGFVWRIGIVARMKRSGMRDILVLDCASLHPGYGSPSLPSFRGVREASEPQCAIAHCGISRDNLWIPGSALTRGPGMTQVPAARSRRLCNIRGIARGSAEIAVMPCKPACFHEGEDRGDDDKLEQVR